MNDDDKRPGESARKAEEASGADAGAPPPGNGKGNGHRRPFDDVYDPDDESGDWQRDLPTEDEVKEKPSSIYAPGKLRPLAKLHDTNLEDYVDLLRRLVAAAQDRDVTRAKIDAAVKAQARKDQQEAKTEAAANGDTNGDKENIIDALIRLGKQNTELFHAPDGQAYATATIGGRPQTLRVKGNTFLELLINRHIDETGRGVSGDTLKGAAVNLAALAKRPGAPRHAVFPRIGTKNGNIYVDRGSEQFDAYEIRPAEKLTSGKFRPVWSRIAQPPVKFVRPEGTSIGELPIAKTAAERELHGKGGIEALRRFLPAPDEATFILSTSWVLGCYSLEGDKAAATITGEGGSGKTSMGRFMCALVDPLPPSQDTTDDSIDRRGHMRAPPTDYWDCALAAQTTWTQAYDNISEIDAKMADVYCRLSTGGAVRRRSFYGLLDETSLSARRPLLITAVEDLVVRDDLASRSLFLRAGREPDAEAADEVELWLEFETEWPALLGCIFDAISVGLANRLPSMKNPPRLARLANWVSRCEVGLGWEPGTFMAAYQANQVEGAEVVADANPVITAVRDFVTEQQKAGALSWSGTPTDLYKALEVLVGAQSQRSQAWPKRPAELSKKLRNSAKTLATLRIQLTIGQRTGAAAQLGLSWPKPPDGATPSAENGAPEETAAAPRKASGNQTRSQKNQGESAGGRTAGNAGAKVSSTSKHSSKRVDKAGQKHFDVGNVGNVSDLYLVDKRKGSGDSADIGLPPGAGRRLVARI